MVESLMSSLLDKLVDTHLLVRKFCIRGLGNITSCDVKLVHKFSTTVLSAIMAGMDDRDDRDDDVTLEAMNGLSKVVQVVERSTCSQSSSTLRCASDPVSRRSVFFAAFSVI